MARTRPTPREHDACGIGFVADAAGRSSRQIVETALAGLAGVRHRGAVAADARSGDGCGLLTPIPTARYGADTIVAMLFCRGDNPRPLLTELAAELDLEVVDWRRPPTDESVLGRSAAEDLPALHQVVLRAAPGSPLAAAWPHQRPEPPAPLRPAADAAELAAWRLRRHVRRADPSVYVASCSSRTIVHKGLVRADELAAFWLDLAEPDFSAPFAVFHQRFSTNTLPTWERAQPFRTLCHNGEINTIWGNEHDLEARPVLGAPEVGLGREAGLRPLLDLDTSDSGQLDEVLDLLQRGGRHATHAVAMTLPPAWEHDQDLDPAVRGFYAYHSALLEPWDGPAGIVFTDGLGVGAALDRNGLRPLRLQVCEDGLVVACSEVGAVPLDGHGRVRDTRLGPGQVVWLPPGGPLLEKDTVRSTLAGLAPYARWAEDGFRPLRDDGPDDEARPGRRARQLAHGYNQEEVAMILRPMAQDAKEASFAMGDDAPLPHLATRPRPVFHFLRQRFAQVTNPPIDPLREQLVMSLRTLVGPKAPLLLERPEAAQLIELTSPIVFPGIVDQLTDEHRSPFGVVHLDATMSVDGGTDGLRRRVHELREEAVAGVRDGAGIVLIDQSAVAADRAPVPSLLALGAVHHHLVASGQRADCGLVVVSDDVRDTHGVACLVGFGADVVCPRLALETVADEADDDEDGVLVASEAQEHLRSALEAGLLKIMSKMGITTAQSYRGAQLFEIIGLGGDLVAECLPGTPSVIGGLDYDAIAAGVLAGHAEAFPDGRAVDDEATMSSPGWIRVRRNGEPHANDKATVDALSTLTVSAALPRGAEDLVPDPRVAAAHLLQRFIAGDDVELYDRFAALVDERSPMALVDQLEVVGSSGAVPLEEVEPASAVVARFSTGAMSHGALSKEAHETLAQAMNLIGAQSNCGEGGEDPVRFRTRGSGREDRNSRIKQVASGRFGVTPEYLAFADEIQIKMAQGSKPGEGGQLPGHKVTEEIARLRYTQPGIGLISPPPHHDIYSIEDLAQLIYDLKQVNGAEVSVKLVAESGVGTVAAGCAKALADVVHISGANGGTGASPLSAIKHAGMPWELGLAEAQHALVDNDLRSRVRLRVDGGFATGRQVLVAALLGADEFSFGTAVMIAEGCVMLRACHKDTCKPGVATQRPNLRANFRGTPEGVAAYLLLVAHDVRRRLAALGVRSLGEIIGRSELLGQRHLGEDRADAVDLTPLLRPAPPGSARAFTGRAPIQSPRSHLGDQLLADAFRGIWDGDEVVRAYTITNRDRTVGAALSGALALEYGDRPPLGSAHLTLTGAAGQSFGAFLGAGVHLDLVGAANDYVGKGMAAGRISIRPAPTALPGDEPPVLAGNTCLYGATGGSLFVAGAAGERFAVRNSGAVAVVEGVGAHCAEYMTGGTIVVLGPFGENLGAGMTGGEVFLWTDGHHELQAVNLDLVEVVRPDDADAERARWLVEEHVEHTGSATGTTLLRSWSARSAQLRQVLPRRRVERLRQTDAQRVTVA